MTFLGDDWHMGPDGLRFRHAARVLVFDPRGRLLLARGRDLHRPTRHWWFTIGGGRDSGESAREAASRELREETGLVVAPADLIGPVISRAAIFDFAAETVRQYEEFFTVRLTQAADFDTSGWSHIEKEMITELRWWDLRDLAATAEQVYPEGLAEIATRLDQGWDGRLIELGEVHDPETE